MDTAQWPQEIMVKPIEEIIVPNTCSSASALCSNLISNTNNTNNNNSSNNSNNSSKPSSTSLERKIRPQKDQALNCPRCNSTNTKFCYYNNYSLTQPRYFCKTCRRYWTEGGSLRNIPVGGGSRKNKRSSSSSSTTSTISSSSTSSTSKKLLSHDHIDHHHHHHLIGSPQVPHHHNHHHLISTNPKLHPHHEIQGQDLNLGFPQTHQEFRSLSEFLQLPTIETSQKPQIPTSAATNTASAANHHHHLSALELLNGLTSSRGLTPFMPIPDPNGVYSSGFHSLQMQDFKPTLNFSLDGLGHGYGSLQGGVQMQQQDQQEQEQEEANNNNNGRLLFPFEDLNLKQVSSTTQSADHHHDNNNNSSNEQQNREHGDSTGYWTGMLGSTGGSW